MKKATKKTLTAQPADADIQWARRHGWDWDGEAFTPAPTIKVIVNPMEHQAKGWTPWLSPVGALQMDAPFGSVRAALRVAEQIRRQRPLEDNEMSCSEP